MSARSGWEREFRTHFDDIVPEYDNARPDWPSAIFDDIAEYMGASGGNRALEIGAGTGKATEPFLSRGFQVTAVELSGQMAAFLQKRFGAQSGFRVVNAAFEDAALPDNAFDLVFAASAFHWVNAEIGCPKVYRLLRDSGTFALFRYNLIASPSDPAFNAVRAVQRAYYDAYYAVPERPAIRKTHADFTTPDEIFRGFRFHRMEDYGFRDTTMKFYDRTLTYCAEEYVAFLQTLSDHRNLPDDIRAPYEWAILRAIKENGGVYRADYVFELYIGRK